MASGSSWPASGLGLIRREGGRLVNAPDVERFLVADSRHYAAPWMFFTRPDWDEWGRLADHLRRPGPPLEENASVADITVEEARRYHEATRAVGAGAGRLFARTTDLSGKTRMMGYRRRLRGVVHCSLPGEPGFAGGGA